MSGSSWIEDYGEWVACAANKCADCRLINVFENNG
jgi:hypothetical protein